jgi:hypothetical protein
MEPVIAETTSELSLQDALEKADKFEVGFLPVITSQDSRTIEGLLDINSVHRKLSAEILSKQKEADRMATAG